MIPLLLLSSVTLLLSTQSSAGNGAEQAVRDSKNAEFLAAHYPPGALKRGEQGKVTFRIAVERNGFISSCEATESSGFATLDKETCDFVVQFLHPKPARDASGNEVPAIRTASIVWLLPKGAATVAAAPTAATMAKPDKVVCKRERDSGLMSGMRTICLSEAEWTLREKLTREQVESMIGSKPCSAEGC
jgi:TonB family protein